MKVVCFGGNGGDSLGRIQEGDRSVPLAQAVVTGLAVERCVDGANVIPLGFSSWRKQDMPTARPPATWWLPTRCSLICSAVRWKTSKPSHLNWRR